MNQHIAEVIFLYYRQEINEKMPPVISPNEDPNLVCCVMDKLKIGRFKNNVVYGRGEYFRTSVDSVITALRRSKSFKEITSASDNNPKFRYIGNKK